MNRAHRSLWHFFCFHGEKTFWETMADNSTAISFWKRIAIIHFFPAFYNLSFLAFLMHLIVCIISLFFWATLTFFTKWICHKKMCIIRPISLLVEFVPNLSDIIMLPEFFWKTVADTTTFATNCHSSLFSPTQGSLKIWTEHSVYLYLLKSKLLIKMR